MKGKKYRKWLEKHQDRPSQMSMVEREFADKLRSAANVELYRDAIRQRIIDAVNKKEGHP